MATRTNNLQAVVFDLDGIMANTEDLYEEACELVLGRRGKTYDLPLREQMMGRPVADALQIMIHAHSLSDTVDALMDECREVLNAMLTTRLAPLPGVADLIDKLEATGFPMAVATSALGEYADFVLTRLEFKRRLRFVLTSEDIQRGKPDPEIYLLAARRLQLATNQILVLEDSANGCRAAVAAGAFTVAVPNRHTANHNFDGAKFIAQSLADPRIAAALGIQDRA
jgi:HAD superfamily hydrolase (TIGR01509 family)